MPAEIQHWRQQRQFLQDELAGYEAGTSEQFDLSVSGRRNNVTSERIAELKRQIALLDRHIAKLEKSKNA